MIDHLSLKVNDLKKSKEFYELALKPLRYSTLMDFGVVCGLGVDQKPDF